MSYKECNQVLGRLKMRTFSCNVQRRNDKKELFVVDIII